MQVCARKCTFMQIYANDIFVYINVVQVCYAIDNKDFLNP